MKQSKDKLSSAAAAKMSKLEQEANVTIIDEKSEKKLIADQDVEEKTLPDDNTGVNDDYSLNGNNAGIDDSGDISEDDTDDLSKDDDDDIDEDNVDENIKDNGNNLSHDNDADITGEDLLALGSREQDMDGGEDELVGSIKLDDTDADGDLLNENSGTVSTTGDDLDVPGVGRRQADMDAIGEGDEENDYYSLGSDNNDEIVEGTP